MKEAMFYEKSDGKIRCKLCWRECLIKRDSTGFCRVRKNIDGKLFSLNYGKIVSLAIDPIEKKPFFHFAPGSHSLSIASVGCTFRCAFCCNFPISQEWDEIKGKNYSPKDIVKIALRNNVQGISYTYTEPTAFFEFAYDVAKLAKKANLYNNFVTNGYTQPEAIRKISKYLDAVVIDLKNSGDREAYRRLSSVSNSEKIFESILEYKRKGVWIEITNLIIPKFGEDLKTIEKFCKWIYENLGEETSLHFIRFFPSYKLFLPQTDIGFLEKCVEIARKTGLKFVYIGNVPGHNYENTYCPECGELLIDRFGVTMVRIFLDEKMNCPRCGEHIPIAGEKWIEKRDL
jgi:pyruvate formate lyase activating enzyme